jgi:hypothetical protein
MTLLFRVVTVKGAVILILSLTLQCSAMRADLAPILSHVWVVYHAALSC